MAGRMGRLARREAIEGYLFASPGIIGLFVFILGPMIASLILSFCEYQVFSPAKWMGLSNYKFIFSKDPLFWKSLYNTAYYTVFSVPLGMLFALACALLLNHRLLLGRRLFRTAYYLPAVTSGVAVSFLWLWLLDPSFGLINLFLERIGIPGPLWLQSEVWSKPGIILMSVWAVGTTTVIYVAGLQGIPEYFYEAAEVDGANWWQQLVHITLPMLSPTLLFTFVMGIIGSFQVFTQAYVMTEGGPMNSTLFYVLYLYRQGFVWLHMGYASALAWLLFFLILCLTLLVFKSSPLWVYYESKRGGVI
ncbi:MAG: carbohydrate ABC transporter permease [bacterium]